MFSFRPIFSFAGREAELLRTFEAFQDFRIGYQRRNAFRSNVSVNDRVDQRWRQDHSTTCDLSFPE